MKPWATVSKHMTPRGRHSYSSYYSLSPGIGNENFGIRMMFCAHLPGERAAPGARADVPKNECGPRVAAVWDDIPFNRGTIRTQESSE